MKTKIQLSQFTEFYENLNICIRSRKWSGFSVCTTYASIHTHVYGVWQYITFIKMCQMIIGMYWKDINSKAKEHTHTHTKNEIPYRIPPKPICGSEFIEPPIPNGSRFRINYVEIWKQMCEFRIQTRKNPLCYSNGKWQRHRHSPTKYQHKEEHLYIYTHPPKIFIVGCSRHRE